MASRRSFLIRIDPQVLEDVQRWANDDLRSLNGQIEYLLRRAVREAGRLAPRDGNDDPNQERADGSTGE